MIDKTKLANSNLPCLTSEVGAEGPQVPVPPPFGANQNGFGRCYQWIELIRSEEPQDLGTRNNSIPREWQLDQKYHAAYWRYVEYILSVKAGYVEAKIEPPWLYAVYDLDDELWLGIGFYAVGEDVNDFAYLCCYFEEHGKTVLLAPPEPWRLLSTIVLENDYPTSVGEVGDSDDASGRSGQILRAEKEPQK